MNEPERLPNDEELRDSQKVKAPGHVDDRLKRGRKQNDVRGPERRECLEFWRGNQYVFRNSQNHLVASSTASGPGLGDKPRHRVRTVRNMLIDVVAQEVSAASQRTPSYEVNPSSADHEDLNAAKLAEKVALYGYDAWNLRTTTERVVTYAVVADEGFARPYFDVSVGKQIAEGIGTGEVKVEVLHPNQVYWEPGQYFEESPWHAIESARTPDSVYRLPGYYGGKLSPDAKPEDIIGDPSSSASARLVMVTEYLERPTLSNPKGRRIMMANGRMIVPEEGYPCADLPSAEGEAPLALHRLSYFIDPGSDRDMGLVRHLLDPQRTVNDVVNKVLEWKNLALVPQILAPRGSLLQPITDEPGAVFEYMPVQGQIPQWRPTPPVPTALFDLKAQAEQDIARISAQNQIPAQVESGKGIEALMEKDSSRRQAFLARVAEFHSRLMRHCLYLVQKHYTEPRLLKFTTKFGPDTVDDFLGSQLRNQIDVRVFPGSIAPLTRDQMQQQISLFVQAGWLTKEEAMAALQDGTVENLIDQYEIARDRIHRVIKMIKTFPESVNGRATKLMPRPFDQLAIHKMELEKWMQTADFDRQPEPVQEMSTLYHEGVLALQSQQMAREAQNAQSAAAANGLANAQKPQPNLPRPVDPSNVPDPPA